MALLALSDRERLDILAAIVIDNLNSYGDEATLENSAELGDLYNVASAIGERYLDACINPPHQRNRERDVDRDLTERLRYAAHHDGGELGRVAKTIIDKTVGAPA